MTAQGYPEEEHPKDTMTGDAILREGARPGHSFWATGWMYLSHLCGHSHTVSGFVFNS